MKYIITISIALIATIAIFAQKEEATCGSITLPAHLAEEAMDDFRLLGCTKFEIIDADEWTRPRYVTIDSYVQ